MSEENFLPQVLKVNTDRVVHPDGEDCPHCGLPFSYTKPIGWMNRDLSGLNKDYGLVTECTRCFHRYSIKMRPEKIRSYLKYIPPTYASNF